jgi:LEA14-like dessication related protein
MRSRVFNFKAFFAVCLLLSAAFILSTCKTLEGIVQEPEISIASVEFAGIDFGGIDLVAKVQIENPNPVSIPFPETGWDFQVEKKSFLSGTIPAGKTIAARSASAVDVPFRVAYAGLFNLAGTVLDADEIPCTLALDAKFDLPLIGDKVFHAEFDKNIPIVKLPSLAFRGISLKSLSLTKVEFVLNWALENKNNFAVSIDTFNYNLKVNGSSWSEGGLESFPEIGAKSTAVIPLTISLNSLGMIRDITALVNSGAGASYDCTGSLGVSGKLPSGSMPSGNMPGLKGIDLPFNFTGSTRLR